MPPVKSGQGRDRPVLLKADLEFSKRFEMQTLSTRVKRKKTLLRMWGWAFPL